MTKMAERDETNHELVEKMACDLHDLQDSGSRRSLELQAIRYPCKKLLLRS